MVSGKCKCTIFCIGSEKWKRRKRESGEEANSHKYHYMERNNLRKIKERKKREWRYLLTLKQEKGKKGEIKKIDIEI